MRLHLWGIGFVVLLALVLPAMIQSTMHFAMDW